MSFLDNITAKIPFLKRQDVPEYFFALNIGLEKIKACVWTIEQGNLKIINTTSSDYHSTDEILEITDKLLDSALGILVPEPEKILFGVPDSFLMDEELKEPSSKMLQEISKSLGLQPMAYVATSHAISHLLDKTEGGPTTAILVDIGKEHLATSVVRAGKIDGTRLVTRGDNLASDVEKSLLGFTEMEVLPSKILIFSSVFENLDERSSSLSKQKEILVGFSWMNKLPFLHIPKIDVLASDFDISGIALAGAVEIDPTVKYIVSKEAPVNSMSVVDPVATTSSGSGFVTGDIEEESTLVEPESTNELEVPSKEDNLSGPMYQDEDIESSVVPVETRSEITETQQKFLGLSFLKIPSFIKIPNGFGKNKLFIPAIAILALILAYLFLPGAKVTIFVEPKVLEKDAQVIADPSIKTVNEDQKKIPGQVVETQVTGSDKLTATGTKQIGDPAKGTIKIINNSGEPQTLSQGTTISTSGIKFTLNSTVNVASTSATSDSKSTASASVTAAVVGADGNVASGTQFSSSNSQVAIVAEGNFSGGTSKSVTVVTDEDQKKLLAKLAANLRKQAQQDLQGKLPNQKILEEALTENIVKKSYSKNINDQASDFGLDLTVHYKGIAYLDADLKSIVAKLVDTNIPEDYQLDLNDTETQADVSKMENNQLIFLARFKAKLTPKLDLLKIKNEIRGQTVARAGEILRGYDNVLESDILITPPLPSILARLPILTSRIQAEVKLK